MDNVITCRCGARLRRPARASTEALRCPLCHNPLPTAAPAVLAVAARATVAPPPPPPVAPPVAASRPAKATVPAVPAGPDAVGALCPTCQTTIQTGEDCVSCPSCHQHHHRECWDEIGGCAVYGCDKAPVTTKDAASASEPVMSAWGDNKVCPVCGEKIKAIAIACRYCGVEFGTVDPLTAADLHARHLTNESLKGTRTGAIALFACSVIGLAAPIMLIVSLVWVLSNRKTLGRAGPVYLVLGYGALILSAVYSILMLCFIIL